MTARDPRTERSNGDLYGAKLVGGSTGSGTLFRLTPTGDYTRLTTRASRTFSLGLAAGPDGALNGNDEDRWRPDAGAVFRLDSNGQFSLLHSFDGADEGAEPRGELVAAGGNLWHDEPGRGQGLGTAFPSTPPGT